MELAKSAKLAAAEAVADRPEADILPDKIQTPVDDGPIKIREIECCNEFVAILQLYNERKDTMLEVPEELKLKAEGLVVGVGPGLPTADGGRCPSQFELGDAVIFQERNKLHEIRPLSGPYAGRRVLIFSERNILCKLPPVPFEVID